MKALHASQEMSDDKNNAPRTVAIEGAILCEILCYEDPFDWITERAERPSKKDMKIFAKAYEIKQWLETLCPNGYSFTSDPDLDRGYLSFQDNKIFKHFCLVFHQDLLA